MTACAVIPRRSLFVWPAGHGFQISVDAPVETLHLYVRRSLVEEVGLAMGYDGIDLVLEPRLGVYDELLEQLALEARRLASRKDRASHVYVRSEEHTSELQSLMRISYAVFCLKKKKQTDYTDEN